MYLGTYPLELEPRTQIYLLGAPIFSALARLDLHLWGF